MPHSKPTQSARSLAPSVLCLALLALGSASCATTDDSKLDPSQDETYRPLGPGSRENDSIGKYLTDLSTSIRAWNEKTLTASTTDEIRKHSLLEINIRERVAMRHAGILGELENGPTSNRIIAAAALGFSGDPADVSPLLVALDDPVEKVVSNALLGLSNLESPETPMHHIGELMRYSTDSRTRWSAADCAVTLIAAGADPDGIVEAARAGLTDAEEPMVRTQSALIVGLIGDTTSIDALGNLLFDEIPIVARSAAKSLAFLGRNHKEFEGPAARALFRAMAEGDRTLRMIVYPSLVNLSQRDYDLDVEQWERWVKKLP